MTTGPQDFQEPPPRPAGSRGAAVGARRRAGGAGGRTRVRGGAGSCPRCGGRMTEKIPVWAIVLAVLFFPIGLLFLLAKERRCIRCG